MRAMSAPGIAQQAQSQTAWLITWHAPPWDGGDAWEQHGLRQSDDAQRKQGSSAYRAMRMHRGDRYHLRAGSITDVNTVHRKANAEGGTLLRAGAASLLRAGERRESDVLGRTGEEATLFGKSTSESNRWNSEAVLLGISASESNR